MRPIRSTQLKLRIIVIVFWMLFVSSAAGTPLKDYHGWALIVDITKYEDPAITITDFNDSLGAKLKAVLVDVGGYPKDRVVVLENKQCTFQGIKLALEKLSQEIEKNDRLIMYFRGCVAKPSSVKPAYLLAYDAQFISVAKSELRRKHRVDSMAGAISEKLLNQWLNEIKAKEHILIMDYYTFKSDARQYTINREIIGTSSINVFQLPSTKIDVFGEKVVESLKSSETDTDDTRLISVRELYEYVTRKSGIYLSPMGDLDATVIELPSMLQIKTVPPDAELHVNGKNHGLTPQRIIEDLKLQSYEIKVHKNGYLIPKKRVTRIRSLRGESANFVIELVPIKVYGKVKMASTDELPSNVEIEVKDWVSATDDKGNYSLDDWDEHGLELGKKYKLVAKSSELYYGSADFVLDGEKNIQLDIELRHRNWFEIAQIRFDQEDYEDAVMAFQTGVEEAPNFTEAEISPYFADVLYDYFKEAILLVPDNQPILLLNYIIATAKLAEQLELKNEAKRYWQKVEKKSTPGSASRQLAVQHLNELSPHRNLIKFTLIALLAITLISGGYLIYKYKKQSKSVKEEVSKLCSKF